ncbi:TPA: hypothetical protein NV997_001771 [Escherichia coli]|nr:hypothetical protein [Escherichia coli]HCJ9157506.1 hypothetical protein [Escherichia coli]HCJ9493051.1 hypothetical protein [Escherichia coli]HCJ9660112.1 hypothetical protein [Escherichia coli]HCJ9678466.1 hypothetical protein [Escherichia coli]
MESNIKGLVSAGHEMASELKASCGAVDVRSLAQLISDLATQLEVQLVRANALAAENAGLKDYLAPIGLKVEGTPTTDAFLDEVMAQGVEMYADNLDNGADDAERGGFDYAVKFLRSEASSVRLFADQLRKGGNQ